MPTILFLLFGSVQSHALCSSAKENVDLSEKFGTMRFQGRSEFCYAFAAAEILQAEIHLPPPKQISAFAIGTEHISATASEVKENRDAIQFENISSSSMNSWNDHLTTKSGLPPIKRRRGWADMALVQVLRQGFACFESEVPSESFNKDKQFISKQVEKRAHLGSKEVSTGTTSEVEFCSNFQSNFTNLILLDSFRKKINDLAAYKLRDSVREDCKNQISLPKMSVHTAFYEGPGDAEKSIKKIDTLMDEKKPFIISYDPCLLLGCIFDREPMHAGVVSGRRWNPQKNRCELQIRNFNGINCAGKGSDVECEEKSGVWWISEESLARRKHDITYLTAE